jgi:hypothetical protein
VNTILSPPYEVHHESRSLDQFRRALHVRSPETRSIMPLPLCRIFNFCCRVNNARPKHLTRQASEKHAGANLILHNCILAYTAHRSIRYTENTLLRRNPQQTDIHTTHSTLRQIKSTHQAPMPALFTRDTNTPTMSGENPFQSANATAVAAGQENQANEAQQHKQVLEKKAAADKKYVQEVCGRKWDTKECLEQP